MLVATSTSAIDARTVLRPPGASPPLPWSRIGAGDRAAPKAASQYKHQPTNCAGIEALPPQRLGWQPIVVKPASAIS